MWPKGVFHCHRGVFIMAVDSLINWVVPTRPDPFSCRPYPCSTPTVGASRGPWRRLVEIRRAHSPSHDRTPRRAGGAQYDLGPGKDQNPTAKILTGGAPPPAPILLRAESIGFKVSHGYGLTETAGLVVTWAWKREWNSFPA